MFYCYILYSNKLDKCYVGSTSNPEERLQKHNASNKGFTSTGKPWVIKYTETFETRSQAIKREMQFGLFKKKKST